MNIRQTMFSKIKSTVKDIEHYENKTKQKHFVLKYIFTTNRLLQTFWLNINCI